MDQTIAGETPKLMTEDSSKVLPSNIHPITDFRGLGNDVGHKSAAGVTSYPFADRNYFGNLVESRVTLHRTVAPDVQEFSTNSAGRLTPSTENAIKVMTRIYESYILRCLQVEFEEIIAKRNTSAEQLSNIVDLVQKLREFTPLRKKARYNILLAASMQEQVHTTSSRFTPARPRDEIQDPQEMELPTHTASPTPDRHPHHVLNSFFRLIDGNFFQDTSASDGTVKQLQRKEAAQKWLLKHGFRRRFFMALFSGLALIVPMLIMAIHNSLTKSLITSSLFVLAFAFVLALEISKESDIVLLTAAYATVLVVFVGVTIHA